MPSTATSSSRLEARVSKELKQLVERAAEITDRNLTDFIVAAVQNEARRVIEQADLIRLSLADQQSFANALLSPPAPNAALQRAKQRHAMLLRAE